MENEACKWKLIYDEINEVEYYETSCGQAELIDEDLSDHGYNFCPYCGKKIKEIKK